MPPDKHTTEPLSSHDTTVLGSAFRSCCVVPLSQIQGTSVEPSNVQPAIRLMPSDEQLCKNTPPRLLLFGSEVVMAPFVQTTPVAVEGDGEVLCSELSMILLPSVEESLAPLLPLVSGNCIRPPVGASSPGNTGSTCATENPSEEVQYVAFPLARPITVDPSPETA